MATPEKFRDKYRIRWTDYTGKRCVEVHDSFRDAEKALRARQAEADAIKAGTKAAPPVEHTFGELCDYWLANQATEKRSEKDDQCVIRKHLRPALGAYKLTDIGAAQIDALRISKRELSPKTVSNILTLLGTMLRAAVDMRWLAQLPWIKKPKAHIDATEFRYLQTEEELQRFLKAAGEAGADVLALYATAVYTGMRLGELAALRWTDINWNGRLIAVQRSHEGLTKSGRMRRVPILDPLLPILREWRMRNPSHLVFPNRDGEQHEPSARIFQERLHDVLDAAGFERPTEGRYRHAINFHSLRHTFASHWAMNGGDMFRLQKALGHQSIQMTMRYAHLQPDAFAQDYGRMGAASVLKAGESVLPQHTRFEKTKKAS